MSRQSIEKATVRAKLDPSPEPYWVPLEKSKERSVSLGFRCLEVGGRGTWIARYRPAGGKYVHESLGAVTAANDYDAACKAARVWAGRLDQGVTAPASTTVRDACDAYLKDLLLEGRTDTEADQRSRLEAYLFETTLASLPLDRIREKPLKEWRLALKGKKGKKLAPATVDRILCAVIASLNFAVDQRMVSPDLQIEWNKGLKKSGQGGVRDLYLDSKQRARLIAKCPDEEMKDLVAAIAMTGMRFGEAQGLTVINYHAKTGTLVIPDGKTGGRSIPLSDEARALFGKLVKNKLPAASLLTDGGEAWKTSAYHRRLKAACAEAKLPANASLYTLRHSYITDLLRAAVPVAVVADLAGTSIAMIQKNYWRFIPSHAATLIAGLQMVR